MIKNNKYFLKKKRIVFSICVFLCISLFIPFNLIVSDEKIFQVVDEKGNPISNCTVEHEWTQYALMLDGTYTTFSNENGFVYLPKKTVRTTIFKLVKGAYNKIKMYGIHASFTSDDIVTLSAPNFETKNIFTDFQVGGKVILKKKQPR